MSTKIKSRPADGEQSAATKPDAERRAGATPASAPQLAFSRLVRSIDHNLSVAHRYAEEAKKRLG